MDILQTVGNFKLDENTTLFIIISCGLLFLLFVSHGTSDEHERNSVQYATVLTMPQHNNSVGLVFFLGMVFMLLLTVLGTAIFVIFMLTARLESGGVTPAPPPSVPAQTAPPVAPTPTFALTPTAQRIYTVIAGDTLYGIAQTFNLYIEVLKRANGLTDSLIKPEQKLVISANQ